MNIDRETGLLDVATQVNCPNYDLRPEDTEADLIIIHGISLPPGQFGGNWIDALFTNTLDPNAHPYFQNICGLRVSSHLLIRRTGEIIQYVPFQYRAWHAGQSNYKGRDGCNDFSIGIELEGSDDQAYEEVQYEQLAAVIKILLKVYPNLNQQNIVGHSDVAPGRKTDPGPYFEWQKLSNLLAPPTSA